MFRLALATTLLALTTSIAAQDVTSADLQALQDAAATVTSDITQARGRDAGQASESCPSAPRSTCVCRIRSRRRTRRSKTASRPRPC